jgi:hypothetical protein
VLEGEKDRIFVVGLVVLVAALEADSNDRLFARINMKGRQDEEGRGRVVRKYERKRRLLVDCI